MVKIGIPSSLFYYVYYPAWETFFSTLGAKVVASGKTTKKILDEGVREALADACVPVKVFFGHALALKNRADFLFIPRIVCLNKKTVYCPKFLGLPDMIRHGLPDMPPIIDVRVDTRTERRALWKAFQQAGKLLGAGKFHLLQAFNRAQRVQKLYDQMLLSGLQPEEAMQQLKGKHNFTKKNKGQLNIAVLGYPYILYDPFINVQLMEKLSDLGVNVLTPENVSPKILDKQKVNIKKSLFWTFSEKVMRAAAYYFGTGHLDGAIHVTAFGCGPDSILNNFLVREAQKLNLPFMTLTIDEHSGEAGVKTRLEAFTDMVKRKRRGIPSAP